jgi:predicted O-methyltransferase YrrM
MSAPHYQDRLPELFKLTRLNIVVETGCSEGVSSHYLVTAMDAQNFGQLHSVEAFSEKPFYHPRLHFHSGFSERVLPKLQVSLGPWDMFLHDSDHEEQCQTFEYAFAWDAVRHGGIIATDDPDWGTHRAWAKFLAKHNVQDQKLGAARYFIRP